MGPGLNNALHDQIQGLGSFLLGLQHWRLDPGPHAGQANVLQGHRTTGLVWFGLGCLEVGFNVDEAGLEHLIFLPLPAKCISKAGYTMLGTEPGVCAC